MRQRERERETDRQTDRQTDREGGRERDRESNADDITSLHKKWYCCCTLVRERALIEP